MPTRRATALPYIVWLDAIYDRKYTRSKSKIISLSLSPGIITEVQTYHHHPLHTTDPSEHSDEMMGDYCCSELVEHDCALLLSLLLI